MFDAQKLLGQVLREAMGGTLSGGRKRRRQGGSLTGLPRGLEAKVGMGLLGLAIAAFEHFRQAGAQNEPQSGSPMGNGAQAASASTLSAGLPPMQPPPPPPAGNPGVAPATADADQVRSLHLLRAMIAAAHADGQIDEFERGSLIARARDAGLDDEEITALDREIGTPLSLEQLVLQTGDALREEVYVAALIAIDPDTEQEQGFLSALATGLQLDATAQARLRGQAGLA